MRKESWLHFLNSNKSVFSNPCNNQLPSEFIHANTDTGQNAITPPLLCLTLLWFTRAAIFTNEGKTLHQQNHYDSLHFTVVVWKRASHVSEVCPGPISNAILYPLQKQESSTENMKVLLGCWCLMKGVLTPTFQILCLSEATTVSTLVAQYHSS